MMQDYFRQLVSFLQSQITPSEQFTCWLSAEETDFVRFNRSAIRQPGHVAQIILRVQLLIGRRHARSSVNLCGQMEQDYSALIETLALLREQLRDLPEDPHLLMTTEVRHSSHIQRSSLPPTQDMVNEILEAAGGLDMVGILTTGTQYRGFANSQGQQNCSKHTMSMLTGACSIQVIRQSSRTMPVLNGIPKNFSKNLMLPESNLRYSRCLQSASHLGATAPI